MQPASHHLPPSSSSCSSLSSSWRLKLSPLLSPFPFVHTPFDISIHLFDNHTQLLKGGEEVSLRIELLTQDSDGTIAPSKEDCLEVGIQHPKIPTSGTVTIPIKLHETSINAGNRWFVLQISSISHEHIPLVSSRPLFVVNHRLVLPEPFPSLWYKDQGGKSNWLKLPIRLVNRDNQNVLNRRVHLAVTLFYENGTEVPRQEILHIGNQAVIGDPGHSTIMLRIEEVSRSHQNQNFIIRISPDINKDPKCNDISTVETTPIHVMSKSRSKENVPTPSSSSNGVNHRRRGRDEYEEKSVTERSLAESSSPPPSHLPPSNLVEWSHLAVQELFILRSKVDYLIQCFQHSADTQSPVPLMSIYPTQSSVIPPHFPPGLYPQQAHLATEPDDNRLSEETFTKKRKHITFSEESIEDSELLLTLHRQMFHQISAPDTSTQAPLGDQHEDEISLTDLPSGLIRQGLDDTVNIRESVGKWKDT